MHWKVTPRLYALPIPYDAMETKLQIRTKSQIKYETENLFLYRIIVIVALCVTVACYDEKELAPSGI